MASLVEIGKRLAKLAVEEGVALDKLRKLALEARSDSPEHVNAFVKYQTYKREPAWPVSFGEEVRKILDHHGLEGLREALKYALFYYPYFDKFPSTEALLSNRKFIEQIARKYRNIARISIYAGVVKLHIGGKVDRRSLCKSFKRELQRNPKLRSVRFEVKAA